MFVRQNRLNDDFYRIIRAACQLQAGSLSVVLLVAQDVDAICACQMLSTLLKHDFISHKIHPVNGYFDMEKANKEFIAGNSELLFVILLNCGGIVDIQTILTPESRVKIFILDSHRPFQIDNAFGETSVSVVDDGEIEFDMQEVHSAWFELNKVLSFTAFAANMFKSIQEFGDDVDEVNDNEDNDVDQQNDAEGVALSENENETDGSHTDSTEHDADEPSNSEPEPDAPRGESPRLRRAEIIATRRKLTNIIAEYYERGTWHGTSIACQMYGLVSEVGHEDISSLWLAIVGLTSMMLNRNISFQQYMQTYHLLKDEANRLNQYSLSQNTDTESSIRSNGRKASDTTIRVEEEFRFIFIRHWSLYEAMKYSPYVISKLKLYSPLGVKRLHKLLAKMGFSLQEAKQIYPYMSMELRKNLREKLDKFSELYGLDELKFPSFTRSWGFKCAFSATDICYTISTVLESSANIKSWKRAEQENDPECKPADESWKSNFHEALEAIMNVDQMKNSLPLAMNMQVLSSRVVTAIIQKKLIKSLRSFRIAVLRDFRSPSGIGTKQEMHIIANPMVLRRLALWIAEADQEEEYGRVNRLPLVLAALEPYTDQYFIIGSTEGQKFRRQFMKRDINNTRPEISDYAYNKFGNAFHEVAQETHCQVQLDNFETSVVECAKQDISGFLEALSLRGLS